MKLCVSSHACLWSRNGRESNKLCVVSILSLPVSSTQLPTAICFDRTFVNSSGAFHPRCGQRWGPNYSLPRRLVLTLVSQLDRSSGSLARKGWTVISVGLESNFNWRSGQGFGQHATPRLQRGKWVAAGGQRRGPLVRQAIHNGQMDSRITQETAPPVHEVSEAEEGEGA